MAGPAGTALPAHILVIDDDERLRDLLQRFLAESGFLVTAAGSAEEARAYLVGVAFDLLVIDCLLYTSPSPRDYAASRMPSSA